MNMYKLNSHMYTYPASGVTMASGHAADDDAAEVFEIQDFSVATPLEVLIAAIEDSLRAWLLKGEGCQTTTTELTTLGGSTARLLLAGDARAAAQTCCPSARRCVWHGRANDHSIGILLCALRSQDDLRLCLSRGRAARAARALSRRPGRLALSVAYSLYLLTLLRCYSQRTTDRSVRSL